MSDEEVKRFPRMPTGHGPEFHAWVGREGIHAKFDSREHNERLVAFYARAAEHRTNGELIEKVRDLQRQLDHAKGEAERRVARDWGQLNAQRRRCANEIVAEFQGAIAPALATFPPAREGVSTIISACRTAVARTEYECSYKFPVVLALIVGILHHHPRFAKALGAQYVGHGLFSSEYLELLNLLERDIADGTTASVMRHLSDLEVHLELLADGSAERLGHKAAAHTSSRKMDPSELRQAVTEAMRAESLMPMPPPGSPPGTPSAPVGPGPYSGKIVETKTVTAFAPIDPKQFERREA
jgi:hypothetical protein